MSRKEKKYHFIYKTIDTRNENFYIGMHSTDNLNDGYIGSGNRPRKLIHKHGKNIFKLEILEYLPDRKSLRKREEEIVNSDLIKEEKIPDDWRLGRKINHRINYPMTDRFETVGRL